MKSGCLVKLIILGTILILCGIVIYFVSTHHQQEKVQASLQVIEDDAWYSNSQSGFSALNDEEKKAYSLVKDAIEVNQTTMDLTSLNLTIDEMSRVWRAIGRDNPQYFWLDSYSYHYDPATNVVSEIEIPILYNAEEQARRQQVINDYRNVVLGQITTDMDDYAIARFIHDYIISNTEYDLTNVDNQNICSVFLNGRSVCAGYAKAFQYLMREAGLFCTVIEGEASGRGAHAWNLASINGNYYYFDVTWDDPSFAETDVNTYTMDYSFFGITTEELLRDHSIDTTLGEPIMCSATMDNYYVREGRLFNDIASFIQKFDAAMISGESQYYAKFHDRAMVDAAVLALGNSVAIGRGSLVYSRNDDLYTLTLVMD